jgi:hypothetical protein
MINITSRYIAQIDRLNDVLSADAAACKKHASVMMVCAMYVIC